MLVSMRVLKASTYSYPYSQMNPITYTCFHANPLGFFLFLSQSHTKADSYTCFHTNLKGSTCSYLYSHTKADSHQKDGRYRPTSSSTSEN